MSQQLGEQARSAASPWVRLLPLWGLLGGLVVGAVWGGLARLWMRLLTASPPSFSWSGTLFIVGIFAIAGMTAGVVFGARRRGWRGHPMRALRLVGLSGTVLLSLGQGAVMAPTLVFGGLAVAGRGRRRWLRALFSLVALAPVLVVHLHALREWPHSPLRLAAALALCLVVYGGAATALAQSYAHTPGAELPRQAWLALLLLPLALLLTLGVDSFGPAGGVAVVIAGAVLVATILRSSRRRARAAVVPDQRPAPVMRVDADC